MRFNRLKVKSFVIVLCSLFLLTAFSPHIPAQPLTDKSDGIWQDTTFSHNHTYYLINTTSENGAIELKRDTSPDKNYDFNYTSVQRNHKAYKYRTFLFLPWWKIFSPENHISKEDIFDVFRNESIKRLDNDYATWNASFLHSFAVHHYRFQLDTSADFISKIKLNWFGKATQNAEIDFYFWNASGGILKKGKWELLKLTYGDGENRISINETIDKKGDIQNALDENKYVDICIVGNFFPNLFKSCSLSTDYINITTVGEIGFHSGKGTITTIFPINVSEISPQYNEFYWEQFTWDDYQGGGTTIHYQLLYENGSNYDPVPDRYFKNNPDGKNSIGFTQSPVYLNAVPYDKLKIRATLDNYNAPSSSPRLFSWALTWQNSSQWKDLFNTSYRVPIKNKATVENGVVNLSKIQGEWPMFGFNSENNRATTGYGPSSGSFYWGSQKEQVGGGFRNPVIGNGKVYIASRRTLYEYDLEKISTIQPYNKKCEFSSDIVNSPAITNDYVIVATGQMADGGSINKIYALPKEDISKGPEWNVTYPENICYFSSPVVAGDILCITSWGGDNGTGLIKYQKNKVIAITLKDKKILWENNLPAASYSTPAVSLSSNIIVAGCSASDNDSIFAYDLQGKPLWSTEIGMIGHSSPVIYKDMVFVLSASKLIFQKQKETKLYALNLSDGHVLWNKTISTSGSLAYDDEDVDDSTPVIYDDIVYVAAPNGTLFAFHISDDTPLWSLSVYPRPFISPQSLYSSPVYADGHVYVGTPSTGKEQIKAVSITSHTVSWTYSTVDSSRVFGSPIVSNGLLLFADENGHFYSIGAYKTPTQYINGSITSMPIKIPESYWWNQFNVNTSFNESISQITFKLVDENNNILKDLKNGDSLLLNTLTLPRTIRLRADFTTKNITLDNPRLNWWTINFIKDAKPPFLDNKTIFPSFGGWLNVVIPTISIKAKDNLTGLLVSSAQYTLEYIVVNKSYTKTYAAYCTGTNGTTQIQNITANISSIPNFKNITALKSITFSIKDLAGNIGEKYVRIQQDTIAPNSTVLKQYIKSKYNETASFIWINASVTNTGTNPSAIKSVELYYRSSSTGNFSGEWVYFANSTQKTSPRWRFNFTNKPSQVGGYFEVCTRALDIAGNIEEFPTHGDATFIYDWTKPELPSYSGDTLWFKEQPEFSVIFEDDFRLHTIRYRPNFDSVWTTIASRINSSLYNTDTSGHAWSLKEEYWDQMQEDEIYYLYFRINDTLGNTLEVLDNNQAIIIRKDTLPPLVTIDVPSVDTDLSWERNFTISGFANDHNGSGIKEAILYYRYSEDNSNWTSWTKFGQMLDTSPFEWDFDALEGDGYYEMKIVATDYAGNEVESVVFPIAIASFPTTLALVLVGLIVVLILFSVIVYLKWRKKESPS